MPKKRKQSDKSKALAAQKPIKRRRKIAITLVPILIATISVIGLFFWLPKPDKNQDKLDPKFQLSLLGIQDRNVEQRANALLESRKITTNSQLIKQIKSVQKKLYASSYHLFMQSPRQAYLTFEFFEPYACIDLGTLRLISEDAKVFGKCDPQKELPMIKGFEVIHSEVRQEDQSLLISRLESEKMESAITILKTAFDQNFQVSAVKYLEHRGFRLFLKDAETEIIIGFSQIDEQFSKLNKIHGSMTKNDFSTAKIELDFGDKAFIKIN
ncbi:MAG: hypothetical protein HRU19_14805 [Pseudobacteriovorax sp.]|nr:hypothetical protein [Pseudobacteriovorax sp.]